MIQVLIPIFLVYAAVGLILSLVVHFLSFFGITLGGTPLFITLHVAIFPLWFLVVFILSKSAAGLSRKEVWKGMHSGCPRWMKYMTDAFYYYALANFALFFVLTFFRDSPISKDVADAPIMWRGFSGHWMLFYWAGFVVLMTAYRRGVSYLNPRCPNGHAVAISDNHCPFCGDRLDKTKMSFG